jgi:hypothetical protein
MVAESLLNNTDTIGLIILIVSCAAVFIAGKVQSRRAQKN